MSEEHTVSRRASLKSLGVMGAAAVLGPAVAAQTPVEPKPVQSDQPKQPANDQAKQPINVVDVAADRFVKGHS